MLKLQAQVDSIYLHIDMDILDFGDVYANHLKISGGLQPDVLKQAISLIKGHFTIAACRVASYDPADDPEGIFAEAGILLVKEILTP